ncbi:MAG: tail fiber domain-containing protein [Chitinophagales bacterium]|nr:tail fiber domain-containing protein [Chitinophagales bacterium]
MRIKGTWLKAIFMYFIFVLPTQLAFGQAETQNTSFPFWKIFGNTNTNSGTHFIGTTDNVSWRVRTNNIERMVADSLGRVGIGTTQPLYKLDILAPGGGLGVRILSGSTSQLTYLSLGRTAEYAQIGACTAGTFFTDAVDGDMAVKNFNSGKLLLGASFFASSAMCFTNTNNIGINNVVPAARLDINGDLALRENTIALTLANGVNSNVAVGTYSHIRITGPTAAFSITGIAAGVNGKIITLINTTAQPMTLSHDVTSAAANRIYTPGGLPLDIAGQYKTVTLMYNSSLTRWVVTGATGETSANDWHLTGNAGISSATNFIGTTNNASFRIRTNNVERVVVDSVGMVGIGTTIPRDALNLTNPTSGGVTMLRLGEISALNQTESGRITFDEGVQNYSGTANFCGFQFHHDGSLNKLFLLGGCTTGANLVTFERTGDVGIGIADPTELLELGTTSAVLYMNSLISNQLWFNTEGVAIPTITSRSVGTKVVFFPQVSATEVDYAMGIASATLWSSVPFANSTYNHRWYAGTTEVMRLRGDGRLGLGIAAPTATRLDCYDPVTSVSRIARFRNASSDGTEIQTASVEYLHDYSSTTDFNDGANTIGLTINFNAASAYDLQLANNSAAKPTNGSWTIISDERLKEDIHPFKDGLEVLEQINPVYWRYNGRGHTPNGEYGIGVLAQSMQGVAPYTVSTMEYLPPNLPFEQSRGNIEQYLAYNPDALHYITLNAVKELNQKQKNTEAVLVNTTEFGTATINAKETTVTYPVSFTNRADGIPVVTVSTVGSNTQLTISSQSAAGFTVKLVGENSGPVTLNWIAAAKTRPSVFEAKKEYSAVERSEMLSKVKLTKGYIRLEAEEREMLRRRAAGE